jgi:hypothetical protein
VFFAILDVNYMKKLILLILPPVIFGILRRILKKSHTQKPQWNTFTYEPMKGVKMYFDPTGPWQKKLLSSEYDNYI